MTKLLHSHKLFPVEEREPINTYFQGLYRVIAKFDLAGPAPDQEGAAFPLELLGDIFWRTKVQVLQDVEKLTRGLR